MASINIKTGDEVIVITGSKKGTQGKITQVFPALNKVVVEGVNMRTRHLKSRKAGEPGQKVQFAMPIHASNVQLIGTDGKPKRHEKRTK
ncbi:50S ribosomal protein L24 [Patescibacteria group bacterium]|nr:50S ribosomal protein L24 [Patescibacteria group bacterium]